MLPPFGRRCMPIRKKCIDGLSELLNINRFKNQQQLDISNFDLNSMNWEKLLRDICNSKIKQLDLSHVDLTILGDKLNIIIQGLSKLNVPKLVFIPNKLAFFSVYIFCSKLLYSAILLS